MSSNEETFMNGVDTSSETGSLISSNQRPTSKNEIHNRYTSWLLLFLIGLMAVSVFAGYMIGQSFCDCKYLKLMYSF